MKYRVLSHPGVGKLEAPVVAGPESTQQIDLCSEIRAHSPQASSGCLGILDSGNTQHRLRRPAAPSLCSYISKTISLEGLLRGSTEKRDRLRLGVQLASAVIQLHTTGWLNKRWGKRDIYFFLDVSQSGDPHPAPVFEKPFLCRHFENRPRGSQSQQNIPPPTLSPLVKCDASLFSLGIVLVELWFGKHIEDFPEYSEATTHQALTNDNAEYHTANELLREIDRERGSIYGNAVRRCIRGLDCTETSLEEDRSNNLKNSAHSNIVSELERFWMAYNVPI